MEQHRIIRFISILEVIILISFAAYSAVYHWKWAIDNICSAAFVLILLKSYKKFNLTLLPYMMLMLFLILHNLGAFGLYSMFPLGVEWDIYVHLYFGFAFSIAAMQFLSKYDHVRFSPSALLIITLLFTMGVSAVHEIIEFSGSQIMGSGEGVLFFGAGDTGSNDAEWDMINNLIGAFCGILCAFLIRGHRQYA